MKRLLLGGLLLLLLLAGGAALLLAKLDPAAISAFAADQASAALGRRVEVGHVQLGLFPPGVRLRSVSVAGDAGAEPLAQIAAIDLGVALRPLLRGAVELRTLTIDAPRLALPLGPDGYPRVPQIPAEPAAGAPGKPAPRGATPPAPTPAEPSDAERGGSAVSLSIQRFRIERGELSSGPWQLRELELEGSLQSLSSARATLSLLLEGVGRLEVNELTADGIGQDDAHIRAEGELQNIDLAALLRLLPEKQRPELELGSGQLSGPFGVELRGSELAAGRLAFELDGLELRAGGADVSGPARLDVTLGERFAIELDGAQIAVPGVLRKPAGDRLTLSGPLGAQPSLAALTSATLALGPAQIPLEFDLAAQPVRVELGPTELDLAALASWLESPPGTVGGRIRSEGLRVGISPLSVDGALQLDAASLAVNDIDLSVSGAVQAQGTRLAAQGLIVGVGDQKFTVSGGYALEPGTLDVALVADAVDVDKLVTELNGSSDLAGTLSAKLALRGPPDAALLSGSGEFQIAQGRIRGFSLVRQFLGQFAEVGMAVMKARGRDLSRFEEEEFESLRGRFALTPGRADFEELALVYRTAAAQLRGPIGVPGGELGLSGELVIRRELGQELSGQQQVREEIVPIDGVGGTVSSPRLRLGRQTLLALATRYAAGGRATEQLDKAVDKLEDKIGKENTEAIKGLLDGLLGRRRAPAEPAPQQPQSAPPASEPARPPEGEPAQPPPSEPARPPDGEPAQPPAGEPAQPPPAEPPPATPEAPPAPTPEPPLAPAEPAPRS